MTRTDFADAVRYRQPSGTPSFCAKRWPSFLKAFVWIHGLCLAMYALLGKGFAYAGFPPVFVGEILLLVAGVSFLAARTARHLLRTLTGLVLLSFVVWQTVCMLVPTESYGLYALRDSIVWTYSLFA